MNTPLKLIAGPCVVEDKKTCLEIGQYVKSICERLNIDYIFKASYKKANRTSLSSFTGIGDEVALQILKDVGDNISKNYMSSPCKKY